MHTKNFVDDGNCENWQKCRYNQNPMVIKKTLALFWDVKKSVGKLVVKLQKINIIHVDVTLVLQKTQTK